MTCYAARRVYPVEGGIAFEKPPGHSGATIKIICGFCTGCRLDHRRDWSTRMMHEASLHSSNQFVTFTYAPDHLPKNGDLDQTHMQKFFKRLRKEFSPTKIRYVYAAEYGGKRSRPHYHAILFGLFLDDLIFEKNNDRGDPLYGSQTLDRIWQKGHCFVGAVTDQSCGYVASYMLKDINGDYDKRNDYTTVNVTTGELTKRKRPFARYSTTPGIGKAWFDKNHADVFPGDVCRTDPLDGDIIRPVPRYYFDLIAKSDPEMHARVKAKRRAELDSPKNRANSTPERMTVRETCKLAKINAKSRGTKTEQQHTMYIAEVS